MFADKFIVERKTLLVGCLKKYFLFLRIQNKYDQPASYRLSISDEDEPWLRNNPLSSGEEVTVVKDFSLLERRDR